MTSSVDTERAALKLFRALMDLPEVEREDYLRDNAKDPALLSRVQRLLAAAATRSGLLDEDVGEQIAGLQALGGTQEAPPVTIGKYRVVSLLGRGGMATVYRAERADGEFEQTVALKVIQPTLHEAAWRERFLQERQILASLRHPNIAQLLDGGVSDDGTPYFALEYVDGLPITKYCDENNLNVAKRLSLMLSVCDAVSYAHRNLVVHRDLKPKNILVNAEGVPKLLDFGIAKLIESDDAMLTQTGYRAMTPGYAAPEQFRGDEVTTSTDVYALGVLLYELVAGRRPFVADNDSPLSIERQVLEKGPPPLARLINELTPEEREEIASARGEAWPGLRRRLQGDFEKIALKALRTEPDRRYRTVEAMSDDIRSFRDDRPVTARSDSAWYRARKFLHRHPVGVALSAIAIAGLLFSTAYALGQATIAREAADRAQLEASKATATRDFLASLFAYSSPDKSLGERLTARQLLDLGANRVKDELVDQPAVRVELLDLLSNTYRQLGLYESALPLAEQALGLHESLQAGTDGAENRAEALINLARLRRLRSEFDLARDDLKAAEATLGARSRPAVRARLLIELGELHRERADFDSARELFQQALAIDMAREASSTEIARDLHHLGVLEVAASNPEVAISLFVRAGETLAADGLADTMQYAAIKHDTGVTRIQQGELEPAKATLTEARAIRERLLDEKHPDLAATYKELAGVARLQGDAEQAENLYLKSLTINEEMLGSEHPETSSNLNSLAVFYQGQGDTERALTYAQRALTGAQAAYGTKHPNVAVMRLNIGNMQRVLGNLDEAEQTIESALSQILDLLGTEHHLAGVGMVALAGVQHDQGRLKEAEPRFREALNLLTATVGSTHPNLISTHAGLAGVLLDSGRAEEALQSFERALSVAQDVLPENHPSISVVEIGRAGAWAASNECDVALRLRDEHLPKLRAVGQDKLARVLTALTHIDQCDSTNS